MTSITLTREFSGFTNVADTIHIGDRDVAGVVAEYTLPSGYSVESGYEPRIIDMNGWACFIEPTKNGVRLMSYGGNAKDVELVAA